MASLPFADTKVPASRSVRATADLLKSAGFDQVVTIEGNEAQAVVAIQDGVTFRFSVGPEELRGASDAIKGNNNNAQWWAADRLRKTAERIAWRLVYHQVKATTDAMKLSVTTPMIAMAGQMQIATETGSMRLGDYLTKSVLDGQLNLPKAVLALEDKR